MKRLMIITILITLLMVAPSCGDKQASAGTDQGKTSKKQTVKLTKTKLTMTAGKTKTIKLRGAKASKVKWISSRKSVAKVSKGKIKARKAGKATITAKYKGKKYKCKVTVKPKKTSKPTQTTGEKQLKVTIGSTEVKVDWKDNESVDALKKLVKEKPLKIKMSRYGGFEQVGSIGTSLPRNDKETTTSAGDIVQYSGNQIVVFYGSNSWAYTRLGHITNKTKTELKKLLGNEDITLKISME